MKSTNHSIVRVNISALLIFFLLSLLQVSSTAWAKSQKPDVISKTATIELNKEGLQTKIDAINSRQGLDEALKSKILSVYQAAQDNLNNSENYKARAIDFNVAIK
ncbi:MAG: hypothetical protein RLZ75_1843, partial [Pseudomonadota bacterium]